MSTKACHRRAHWSAASALFALLSLPGCQPDGSGSGDDGPAALPGEPPVAAEPLADTDGQGAQQFIGLYRYMADAAVLRDCASGRSYPVLIEAGHLALERAYLARRGEPGAEVLAVFDAERVMRAPEPGIPEREHLRVTRFIELRPGESCEDQSG